MAEIRRTVGRILDHPVTSCQRRGMRHDIQVRDHTWLLWLLSNVQEDRTYPRGASTTSSDSLKFASGAN